MAVSWNLNTVGQALNEIASSEGVIRQRFGALLNEYHGTSHDLAYWELIGGEWILHFSHMVYAAMQLVGDFRPSEATKAPIQVFSDHQSFMATAISDPQFLPSITASIREAIGTPGPSSPRFSCEAVTIGSQPGGIRKRSIRHAKRSLFSALSDQRAPLLFCRPYVGGRLHRWCITLRRWHVWARQDDLDYPVNIVATVDTKWRHAHATGTHVRTWVDAVVALMPIYLPVAYLEGLTSYRNRAHALRLLRPRAVYTANSLHGHLLFKVLAADWHSEGTAILNHQHGGGYGIDRIHALEAYETRVADRFYSWGWSDQSKQQPLPAASIRLEGGRRRKRFRVLLNCMTYPSTLYRIHFQPMPGTVERMQLQTVDLVAGLRNVPDLTLRPYSHSSDTALLDLLRKTGTAFDIDQGSGGGPASYACSDLVVHNYLGTAWLETLAMNVPTVCLYDPQTHAFRAAAQPFMDRLAEVGVLHTSAGDAAKHVNSIRSNPADWWSKPDVQSARENFVRQYANFSPNWAAEWQDELQCWLS